MHPFPMIFTTFMANNVHCMENFVKILTLNNKHESTLMQEVLKDRNIPYAIIESTDSMFGGIGRMEYGWGYLEAPEEYREQITGLYKAISEKKSKD